jgi:class 3 adenylate cyclase
VEGLAAEGRHAQDALMYPPEAGPVRLREERRPVTALFADLAGSTELSAALDPADVKLVVGDAVARMIGEIDRFGGFTKDLAGDGVLAFFGAPIASEDDAERAVRASLAIVEAIEAYAVDVQHAWGIDGFGVRVAVTTGPVVVGALGAGERIEYAAFGESVKRRRPVAGDSGGGQHPGGR